MEYNKDSFLAGVSVGRTLKGWASAKGDDSAKENNDDLIFGAAMVIPAFSFAGGVIFNETEEDIIFGDTLVEEV